MAGVDEKGSNQGGLIYGGPLDEVHAAIAAHRIGWLVSAINADTMLETPPGFEKDRHLKLAMNDISEARDGLVMPDEMHVKRLLSFVELWDQQSPLMVHCWAGVSRSTAGVFIALCHLNPSVHETQVAALLRKASPTATPNIRLVQLADDQLGRGGRMVEAVRGIGIGEMTMQGRVFSIPALIEPDKAV